MKYLEILSKEKRVFQIIIEPQNKSHAKILTKLNLKLMRTPYLPSKTLILDVRKSKKILFNTFKNDAQGYILKNKNIKCKHHKISTIPEFRQAWRKAVGIKRHVPSLNNLLSLNKSFGSDSLFLTTNDLSSGAIFLMGAKTGYYWQAFTSKQGRKSRLQYNIVWQGILWSKKRGAKTFDFEGVYDERFPNKSWLGFTHFKKSFGGKEILYPGAYTKYKLPV